jgi:hypothetical protein
MLRAALTIYLIMMRITGQLTFGCSEAVLALGMDLSAASGTRAHRRVSAVRRQGGLGGDLRANLPWIRWHPKGSSFELQTPLTEEPLGQLVSRACASAADIHRLVRTAFVKRFFKTSKGL